MTIVAVVLTVPAPNDYSVWIGKKKWCFSGYGIQSGNGKHTII